MAAYRIVKLDDSWKGRTRQFRYRTDSYLDVQIVEERGVSRIEFRKKMFDAPVERTGSLLDERSHGGADAVCRGG